LPNQKPLGNKVLAFTTEYNGLSNQIITPIKLSKPFNPQTNPNQQQPTFHDMNALWDTGATNSVITKKLFKLSD